MLSRLLIAALWSPAGKELTSWLLFVMFNCVFVTFPCGILGQVWHLIVSIMDLRRLSYFNRTEPTLYSTIFLAPVPAAFSFIELRLTYMRGLIHEFSRFFRFV